MHSSTKPKGLISLISLNNSTLYSGLIPAHLAGDASLNSISIDIRSLANRAGIHFIQAKIENIDLSSKCISLKSRSDIHFDLISLNVGAISDFQQFQYAIPIKPLEAALKALNRQDNLQNRDLIPFHVAGAGLAAVEVCFALRRRWPLRPLILHCAGRVLERSMATALMAADIEINAQQAPDHINTLLCTGSVAPGWLRACGISCDQQGRVLTTRTLQSIDHPWLFAVGDCGCIQQEPRPASGVYAVRAAVPLANNLKRVLDGKRPRPWTPQRKALQLLGAPNLIGSDRAWAVYANTVVGPSRWLWKWKSHLDWRFMREFNAITKPAEPMASRNKRSTVMACRGCAAKLGPNPLQQALDLAGLASLADEPADAQTIGKSPDNRTILSSIDGFPALISDPWLNGRLTALHACSDLWASGADVNGALAVLTLPACSKPIQIHLMSQTLAGICSALEEQNASLLGGHTMESRQPSQEPYGLDLQVSLSVIGRSRPNQHVWGKGPIHPEDELLLSRSLGTGILFAAAMQGRCQGRWMDAALKQLAQSQHHRLQELQEINDATASKIHACTDVTGFGLLGHLNEMIHASPRIQVELNANQIPLMEGVQTLLEEGIASTAAPSNREAWRSLGTTVFLKEEENMENHRSHQTTQELLIDPQTCGPLLVSCNSLAAEKLTLNNWISIGKAKSIDA